MLTYLIVKSSYYLISKLSKLYKKQKYLYIRKYLCKDYCNF